MAMSRDRVMLCDLGTCAAGGPFDPVTGTSPSTRDDNDDNDDNDDRSTS
ncbi:hypothetical protein [Streptomyces sp. NA02536]|nr:hypothetical protein [Streptomyces sp. NA02536]QKW03729.1 hypothetical protein HUT14_29630 [Streptomyces sp. NA02536]